MGVALTLYSLRPSDRYKSRVLFVGLLVSTCAALTWADDVQGLLMALALGSNGALVASALLHLSIDRSEAGHGSKSPFGYKRGHDST